MVAARADRLVEVEEPPTEPLALPVAPLPGAGDARRLPAAYKMSVALAIAVLLVVGGATAWWWTGRAETGSLAAQPAAAAAGPSTASVGAPAVVAPGPALVDTGGRGLPPAAIEGVRRVYLALQRSDMVALKALYQPDDTASSWSTLQKRLTKAPTREGVLAALRRAPEPRREVAYLYSSGDYGLGLTRAGRIAFVGTGQGAGTTESAGVGGAGAGNSRAAAGSSGASGASGVPFECEDSFEGDGLPVPAACRRGGSSDGAAGTRTGADGGSAQGSQCSSDLERCPPGYREGVKSSANPYGCNFDAISARNPCQWRYGYSADGSTGRPAPATPAQRWAACHLSGYRAFC